MNFQKPLPPAPMLPSRGQTTESGFVPVTPSWLSYSATHAPKVLQNPRFYRQNDATATQHGELFSQFCFCKCSSPTKVRERCKNCQYLIVMKVYGLVRENLKSYLMHGPIDYEFTVSK